MMSSLPFTANSLSTWPHLPIPLSSPSTQEDLLMTRIQTEIEIKKAIALRQQHHIDSLVKLITNAQRERDETRQKCIQIQNQILLLFHHHRQNNHNLLATGVYYDRGNRLSFSPTDVYRSMSSVTTTLNGDDLRSWVSLSPATQTGEVTGLENTPCSMDQPWICRPPFEELITHNTCLSNNNSTIDECSDLIISDNNNHGLASLLGSEIDEQELQQRRNMGDEQHLAEMNVEHLAMLFDVEATQPCRSITKPCRVCPSYTLEESIEQCNQIRIPALWCSRDPMTCLATTTMMRRGPLPERGRFVQSVIEAGPLLKDLVLAGSLPNWKCPPPPINCNEIPIPISPSIIPSFHTTHPPHKIFTQSFV